MKRNYLSVIYDEKRTPKTDYPRRLVGYLVKRFNLCKNERILEIGCGRGDFLEAFHKTGLACFGIDLERIGNGALEYEFSLCDISKEKLPFEDEFFDVVYHKSFIEHLRDPRNLMKESYRVLKKNGKLIILTPDWVSGMETFFEDVTHLKPYDELALKDLLSFYDFDKVMTERFYQLPIIWEYPFLRFFSTILRRAFSVGSARRLTDRTGLKFFRFSVELMVLGYGEKSL